jgi:MFS family permease
VATGVRFLPLTCAIFVAAAVAGRLTEMVPRRLLIAAGFLLVGAGLLLMRGLTPTSDWTHLLSGMIVSGLGGGLVGTPLISTAVGVVAPARAGMASGINSTLRQVGIATGVDAIAHGISTGEAPRTIANAPAPLRGLVAGTARSALVDGLNTILLISAVVAFAAAVESFLLIRERDFVTAEAEAVGEEQVELPMAA